MRRLFHLGILLFCGMRALAWAQNAAFVVDNSLGEIKVLDLGQRSVSATIATGQQAAEMLILPDNRMAYVTNPGDNNVAVVDLGNNERVATLPVGSLPGSLIASGDGRFVYVANEGSNEVTVIDAVAPQVLTTIAVGATPVMVNLSPDGRYLYVVNRDADSVSIVDTNRLEVVGELAAGHLPVQFALAPTLDKAYIVNGGSASISVVDLAANSITQTIGVGQGPSGVAFSTDGRFVYTINADSNNISVVDAAQNRVLSQMPVGSQPADMVVTFDSRYGFVSNRGSNNVTLLDLSTRTAELNIAVGAQPFDLQLDPNEDFLYVTNLGSESVSVIDVNQDRNIATIALGGVPVQFTQYNAPTLLEVAPNPAAAGTTIVLNGEGLLPSSTVRFVTTAPPRTVTAAPEWLDAQGLRVTVPAMQGSSAVVSVAHLDGNSSEQVTLGFGTSTTSILAGGLVEAAGFQPAPRPVAGGSLAALFGSFPGVSAGGASAFPLPTTLGNAKVTFNGVPAPLLFSSSGQMNLVVPVRLLAQSSVRVAATAGNQTSPVETVSLANWAAGIFQFSAAGNGAFVHYPSGASVQASNPAQRGETIILFVTGMGDTSPSPLDGKPAPGDPPSETREHFILTVGGIPAKVSFSGLAPGFSGLYQINLEVPLDAPLGDEVPVQLTNGERASNTVRLAVR